MGYVSSHEGWGARAVRSEIRSMVDKTSIAFGQYDFLCLAGVNLQKARVSQDQASPLLLLWWRTRTQDGTVDEQSATSAPP